MRDDSYEGNILKDFIEDRKCAQIKSLLNNSNFLSDSDILELIIDSTNTNKELIIAPHIIARNLLDTFGSIGKVLSSDLYGLKNIKGLHNDSIITILCMKQALSRMSREEVVKSPIIINNWKALIDYLRVSIGHINYKECLQIIYMNKKYHIISEQIQNIGTIDQTPLYPVEIVKYALAIGSTAIVISHNHPSGDHKPSSQDIAVTVELFEACSILKIELIDHIIITSKKYFSFQEAGLLPPKT